MTGRTHAMVGANMVWLLWPTFDPVLIGIAAIAGLLPDLDASESTIKHLQFRVGDRRSGIIIKPFWPLAWVLSKVFRHRGWLHSLVALLAVAAVSFLLLDTVPIVYPAAIALGYASHLALDACTKSGVELLLPVKGSYGLLPKSIRVRTGGLVDMGMFIIGALGIVLYAWLGLQNSPLESLWPA